jgi:hypothetical protein
MNGRYNVPMKAYKILPGCISLSRIRALSPKAKRRLEFLDYCHAHKGNISLTVRHFGISFETFYTWKARFNPYNLSSLESKSTRPINVREPETPPNIEDIVVSIRREDIEKSKYEISEELKRENIFISPSCVQDIINRKAKNFPELINTNYRKRVKRYKNYNIARIKAVRELKDSIPGALVQIDTKHLYVLGRRFFQFSAIDCKTRLSYFSVFKTGSSLNAAVFLQELVKYFPFKITAIQTDNGAEYLLNFHNACSDAGITHYFTYPNCPKQNGRVERVIQTSEYEFWLHQEDLLPNLLMLNDKAGIWNIKYNTKRLNMAIGYKTPVEYLESFGYIFKGGNSTECM